MLYIYNFNRLPDRHLQVTETHNEHIFFLLAAGFIISAFFPNTNRLICFSIKSSSDN